MKTIFLAIMITFASAVGALGCACCAEAGEYSLTTSRLGEYDLGLLSEIRFAPKTFLFMNEAGFDMIKGIALKESDYPEDGLGLTSTFGPGKRMIFNLTAEGGKKGSLEFTLPARVTKFKVDINDGSTYGGGGPSLYKEIRIASSGVRGTGFFNSGLTSPATYTLIFQGRGNMCDNASDFTNWRFEVNGKRARYALFGKTAEPK